MKVDYKEREFSGQFSSNHKNETFVCSLLVRMNPTDGFFPVILALLEDAFKDDDNSDSNTSGFDSMMNFQQYERIENSRCCVSLNVQKLNINFEGKNHFSIQNSHGKTKSIDCSSS